MARGSHQVTGHLLPQLRLPTSCPTLLCMQQGLVLALESSCQEFRTRDLYTFYQIYRLNRHLGAGHHVIRANPQDLKLHHNSQVVLISRPKNTVD
jgi:hypothetical protein